MHLREHLQSTLLATALYGLFDDRARDDGHKPRLVMTTGNHTGRVRSVHRQTLRQSVCLATPARACYVQRDATHGTSTLARHGVRVLAMAVPVDVLLTKADFVSKVGQPLTGLDAAHGVCQLLSAADF